MGNKNLRYGVLFLVAMLLLAWHHNWRKKKELIKIASMELTGQQSSYINAPVRVEDADGRYRVVFTHKPPGGMPGSTYESWVMIHEGTLEVLELGVDEPRDTP